MRALLFALGPCCLVLSTLDPGRAASGWSPAVGDRAALRRPADPDDYASLEEAFRDALRTWRAERAEGLEPPHPVHAFLPRFEELAAAGDGRAVLWVGLRIQDTGRTPGELRRVKRAAFGRVLTEFVEEPLLDDLVRAARRQSTWLEDAEVVAILETAFERSPRKNLAARAGLELVRWYDALQRAADVERAERWCERILERYADTGPGRRAARRLELRPYQLGRVPPLFEGVDADGRPVRLADGRGRVTLLVFWSSSDEGSAKLAGRLNALTERYGAEELALLGVSVDPEREDHRAFRAAHELSWPDLWAGGPEGPVPTAWGIEEFPALFVLDGGGTLRARPRGVREAAEAVEAQVAEHRAGH